MSTPFIFCLIEVAIYFFGRDGRTPAILEPHDGRRRQWLHSALGVQMLDHGKRRDASAPPARSFTPPLGPGARALPCSSPVKTELAEIRRVGLIFNLCTINSIKGLDYNKLVCGSRRTFSYIYFGVWLRLIIQVWSDF